MNKDMRSILGHPVKGRYSRIYCGRGNFTTCRNQLRGSLQAALGDTQEDLYGSDSGCTVAVERQWCFDAVRYRSLGGLSVEPHHWINRPTYQQVVEVQGHRPR
jgi:hypothetical protein